MFTKPPSRIEVSADVAFPAYPGAMPPALFSPSERASQPIWECFSAHIQNPNTRIAHHTATRRVAVWCERRGRARGQIEPTVVWPYLGEFGRALPSAHVKHRLVALRMRFDWLVVSEVFHFNPASSVYGPRHVTKTGTTKFFSAREARVLLHRIEVSTLVGLCDRAVHGTLAYRAAGASAAGSHRDADCDADCYTQGTQSLFRLHDKGGRYIVASVHHPDSAYVYAYREHASERTPRSALAKPRARAAHCPLGPGDVTPECDKDDQAPGTKGGIRPAMCTHSFHGIGITSFRGTGITEYLQNGDDLEITARIAGHESTRTTWFHNRLPGKISLDEIDRIRVQARRRGPSADPRRWDYRMITRSELIQRIAQKQSQLAERDVELAPTTMAVQMAACPGGGGRIATRGFGSFSPRFRPTRYAARLKAGQMPRERLNREPRDQEHCE